MSEGLQNSLVTNNLFTCCRERNIVEKVKSIAPQFQDGVKAFSDSPIIGEVCVSSFYELYMLPREIMITEILTWHCSCNFADTGNRIDPWYRIYRQQVS